MKFVQYSTSSLIAATSLLAGSATSLRVPTMFPPLVLASKSPTRQLILRELGFSDLTVVPADLNERAIGDRQKDKPEALVMAIARAKAAAVQAALAGTGTAPGTLLLAGDQVRPRRHFCRQQKEKRGVDT